MLAVLSATSPMLAVLSATSLAPSRSRSVTVQSSPWPERPGGGRLHSWLAATIDDESAQNVGHCGLEILSCGPDGLLGGGERWPYIRPRAILSGTLTVSPKYRRQGVAQRLLTEAERKARWLGVDEMLLMVNQKNAAALKLYTKLGYAPKPVLAEHGGQVCMSKHLYYPTVHNQRSMLPLGRLEVTAA